MTNPATGEVVTDVANSGPADARAATNAAARAFPMWRDTLPKERAAVLRRWHALILEHANSLGELISLEQGKPLAEGRGEVAYGASYVAWFADEAMRIILATGVGSRNDFVDAFGLGEIEAQEVFIGVGKSLRRLFAYEQQYPDGDHTALVVTPFLGSPNGINSTALLDELASYVASWLAPDNFPVLRLGS